MVAQTVVAVVTEARAPAVIEAVVAMMAVAVVSVVAEHTAVDCLHGALLHVTCLQALIKRLALLMWRVI